MLTHEILRPKKPQYSNVHRFPGGTYHNDRPYQQQQHGNTHAVMGHRYMEKIAYAKWVEGPEVKGKFKVGDIVTYSTTPDYANEAPHIVFTITGIQEICFMAPIDPGETTPSCIILDDKLFSTTSSVPPHRIRLLSEKEKGIVHLRNSQAEEKKRAAETTADKGGNPETPFPEISG